MGLGTVWHQAHNQFSNLAAPPPPIRSTATSAVTPSLGNRSLAFLLQDMESVSIFCGCASRRAHLRSPPMCRAAVDPELLFATNGISGGLGLLCSLLAGRGDTVIVENPSYFLALSIFRDFGLNIVAVDVDADGLRTDDLEVRSCGFCVC